MYPSPASRQTRCRSNVCPRLASDPEYVHLGNHVGLMLRIHASMVSSRGHDRARSTDKTSSSSVTKVGSILGESSFCNGWLYHAHGRFLYLNARDVVATFVVDMWPINNSLPWSSKTEAHLVVCGTISIIDCMKLRCWRRLC